MLAPSAGEPNRLASWPRNPRHALIAAAGLWVIPMLVVSIMVALNPTHRTVTIDSYHYSTASWWAGKDIYIGPSGFNYLPHFVLFYSPFHVLPFALSEVVWRLCAAAAIGFGLWYLIRVLFPAEPGRPFLWATILAMPLAMGALRNGNANAHFGGVTLLAIVAILNRRWWWAAVLIVLATAIKPLGIVLLLLAVLSYGELRWRLAVALLGLAVAPFLFAKPDYVIVQYRGAWANLQACAVVSEHRFADINGILRTFGTELSPLASKLVRVFAGGLTAIVWWAYSRRSTEPWAALFLYALTTAYLMVFNPMNEANSFAILSPALGAWAALLLFRSCATPSARQLGWAIVIMTLSMGLLPNMVRPIFGNKFALFWHPLMALVFVASIAVFLFRTKTNVPETQPGSELSREPLGTPVSTSSPRQDAH